MAPMPGRFLSRANDIAPDLRFVHARHAGELSGVRRHDAASRPHAMVQVPAYPKPSQRGRIDHTEALLLSTAAVQRRAGPASMPGPITMASEFAKSTRR
jgi:hypothetical protein